MGLLLCLRLGSNCYRIVTGVIQVGNLVHMFYGNMGKNLEGEPR